jgi:hypothetical protein
LSRKNDHSPVTGSRERFDEFERKLTRFPQQLMLRSFDDLPFDKITEDGLHVCLERSARHAGYSRE